MRDRYWKQHFEPFVHPKLWLILRDRYHGEEVQGRGLPACWPGCLAPLLLWVGQPHPRWPLVLPPGCEPHPADFGTVERLSLPMERRVTVEGVVGLQHSTSVHVAFAEQHGREAAGQLMERFRRDLLEAIGGSAGEAVLTWRADVEIIVAKQPQPV